MSGTEYTKQITFFMRPKIIGTLSAYFLVNEVTKVLF